MSAYVEDVKLSDVDGLFEANTKVGCIGTKPIDMSRGKNNPVTVPRINASQWAPDIRGRT
jgi:hypothetical protein